MAKIDIDKFVASLIKYYYEVHNIDRRTTRCWFDGALEEQGLEFKNDEIVKTQRRIAAEAKEAIFDNEDERIRKKIIALFKGQIHSTSKEDNEKFVAWLEKQGEQKSAWSEEDERLCQCLIKDQEEALDEVRNDRYGHAEIILDLKEMYRERIDWLESLKKRLRGQ